jgi:hypothetical protein
MNERDNVAICLSMLILCYAAQQVSDSEVQVERVLTAEEQAAKDLADRQEAERLAAQV